MSSKRRAKTTASPKWGDTVVLLITTHGAIITEKKGKSKKDNLKVNTFSVPEGMTIKRGSVSAHGSCTMLNEKETIGFSGMMRRFVPQLEDSATQDKFIYGIMSAIHRHHTTLLHESQEILAETDDTDTKNNRYLKNMIDYVTHFDEAFNIDVFHSGKPMFNKLYQRTNSEAKGNNWVIKAINETDGIDLLTHIRPQTRGDSVITLEDIVLFLKSNKVKTIILFDLSCSSMITPDFKDIEDPEQIDNLREYIKLHKLGGGGKTKSKTQKRRRGGK
jgi:hypothetical protein